MVRRVAPGSDRQTPWEAGRRRRQANRHARQQKHAEGEEEHQRRDPGHEAIADGHCRADLPAAGVVGAASGAAGCGRRRGVCGGHVGSSPSSSFPGRSGGRRRCGRCSPQCCGGWCVISSEGAGTSQQPGQEVETSRSSHVSPGRRGHDGHTGRGSPPSSRWRAGDDGPREGVAVVRRRRISHRPATAKGAPSARSTMIRLLGRVAGALVPTRRNRPPG